jgi:transcriptional regulator with XRE-family HTH domain
MDAKVPTELLGQRLRNIRRLLGLNMLQVAQQWSTTVTYVSAVENGEQRPTEPQVQRLTQNLTDLMLYLVRNTPELKPKPMPILDPTAECLCGKATFCPKHGALANRGDSDERLDNDSGEAGTDPTEPA